MGSAAESSSALTDDDFRGALEQYLGEHLFSSWSAARIDSIARSAGGLSWETFVVEIADPRDEATRRKIVVKRPPLNGPLAPYDLAREGAVLSALRDSDVPVADLLLLTEEPVVGGRQILVSEFVDGEIPELRAIERWDAWRDPVRRHDVTTQLIEVLASVQAFDWRGSELSEALDGARTVTEHVASAIDTRMARIDVNIANGWAANPVARDASRWLAEHVPPVERDEMVIVHGDFRIGNVIWRDDRVAALLDWERADLGDPMQDLGFFCMPMARRRQPELMGMLVSVAGLIERYERATERTVDLRRLHYYLVYWQFVELAQVLNGICYGIDRAPDDDLTGMTSYPLISMGSVDLIELIERFEDGDHVIR